MEPVKNSDPGIRERSLQYLFDPKDCHASLRRSVWAFVSDPDIEQGIGNHRRLCCNIGAPDHFLLAPDHAAAGPGCGPEERTGQQQAPEGRQNPAGPKRETSHALDLPARCSGVSRAQACAADV